jgi:hypothetical protein
MLLHGAQDLHNQGPQRSLRSVSRRQPGKRSMRAAAAASLLRHVFIILAHNMSLAS